MSETASAGSRQATGKRKMTDTLNRVRSLLLKAEAEGVTPEEAESLTAKAAELMAAYGIDRARLGALDPGTDKPGDKLVSCPNPWGKVHAHMLGALAKAMRCDAILTHEGENAQNIHLFGYESDLERTELLYTSLLVQMASALQRASAPGGPLPPFLHGRQKMAWNRSFLLGFAAEVVRRVREAEERAAATARTEDQQTGGPSTALVLADRALVVRARLSQAYPVTRSTRITTTGRGHGAGRAAGRTADIGQGRVGGRRQALRSS